MVLQMKKLESLSPKDAVCFVETGRLVLEKIFKYPQCIFSYAKTNAILLKEKSSYILSNMISCSVASIKRFNAFIKNTALLSFP